jgi:thiol-disulfide isomerase/thioredoxin
MRWLLLAFVGVLGSCARTPSGTYETALARAAADHKPLMIDFFTTWCGPCKRLEQETWKDERVRGWFVTRASRLALDAEKERALAERFHVEAYPTLVFVAPEGNELGRIVGFRDADDFLAEAEDVLAGRSAVTRLREKLAGHEQDPMLRQELGDAYEEAGQFAEALAEYLWCYDEGVQHSPAYAGVRNSFLVSSLGKLAKKHAPARDALRERRDRLQPAVLAPAPKRMDVVAFAMLNKTLGDDQRNLELFDQLGQQGEAGKAARQALVVVLMDTLLEKQRYAELLENAGDIATKLEKKSARLAKLPAAKESNPLASAGRGALEYEIDRTSKVYYECLLGTGRFPEAARVAELALSARPERELFTALVDAALRTQRYDQGRQLVAAWIHKLPLSEEESATLRGSLDERVR